MWAGGEYRRLNASGGEVYARSDLVFWCPPQRTVWYVRNCENYASVMDGHGVELFMIGVRSEAIDDQIVVKKILVFVWR